MNFIDEQSGERCHKRYKNARCSLARKTSPEDNLLDIMRMSLSWSDPNITHLEVRPRASKSKDADFQQQLEYYYADTSVPDDSFESADSCDSCDSDLDSSDSDLEEDESYY